MQARSSRSIWSSKSVVIAPARIDKTPPYGNTRSGWFLMQRPAFYRSVTQPLPRARVALYFIPLHAEGARSHRGRHSCRTDTAEPADPSNRFRLAVGPPNQRLPLENSVAGPLVSKRK